MNKSVHTWIPDGAKSLWGFRPNRCTYTYMYMYMNGLRVYSLLEKSSICTRALVQKRPTNLLIDFLATSLLLVVIPRALVRQRLPKWLGLFLEKCPIYVGLFFKRDPHPLWSAATNKCMESTTRCNPLAKTSRLPQTEGSFLKKPFQKKPYFGSLQMWSFCFEKGRDSFEKELHTNIETCWPTLARIAAAVLFADSLNG